MAIHATSNYSIPVFWDDEFKRLNYINEPFNDPAQAQAWINAGYPGKFTGDLCDMRSSQPSWNHRFLDFYHRRGWRDIGTSYYRMGSGAILPPHGDLYVRYVKLFNLQGQEHTIFRAIVFLEDWRPGHYFELMGVPTVQWRAGDTVEWNYDTPHCAANVGTEYRYTLQITGHI